MLKVAVIGPESTGKSSISERLALRYGTYYVEEYARAYLDAHGLHYDYDTLLAIAKEQWEKERNAIRACSKNILFFDTNLYVLKVWSEFVFGRCHTWILDKLASDPYDAYLLMDIDLPWEKDPMREHPDIKTRKELFSIYKDILCFNGNIPWKIISGKGKERVLRGAHFIDKLLKKQENLSL